MKSLTTMGMRKTVNCVLPLAILGIMIFYNTCTSGCSSLAGSILGLDMKYVALIVPLPLVILTLLNQELLLAMALSFGLGGELMLISFQISHGTYCPYCLASGAILVFLFFFNFRWSHKLLMAVFVLIGFLFFQAFFHGSTLPTYALAPLFLG
jgi:hypothetical protein